MDCAKIGKYIFERRKELNITQKQLSEMLHVSNKTISKWERGLGCPDISMLPELSKAFNISVDSILNAEVYKNLILGGNMKRTKFHICNKCGNVVTSTKPIELSCCGKILQPLQEQPIDELHKVTIEPIEDELLLTINHPMTKEHYISFISYVTYDRVYTVKLYPEQNPQIRFPNLRDGKLLIGCNVHGLYVQK